MSGIIEVSSSITAIDYWAFIGCGKAKLQQLWHKWKHARWQDICLEKSGPTHAWCAMIKAHASLFVDSPWIRYLLFWPAFLGGRAHTLSRLLYHMIQPFFIPFFYTKHYIWLRLMYSWTGSFSKASQPCNIQNGKNSFVHKDIHWQNADALHRSRANSGIWDRTYDGSWSVWIKLSSAKLWYMR